MNDMKQRICSYIQEYMNLGFKVMPEHFLSADLSIDGNQGAYFIEDFWKEFDTSFSEMDITAHFACKNSVTATVEMLRDLIAGKNSQNNKLVDLRVSDLIAAVERGAWSDSILKTQNLTMKVENPLDTSSLQ